jgi:hypothetical protein
MTTSTEELGEFILPWNEEDERVASTVDLKSTLLSVQAGSLEEYQICWEAAKDDERKLSDLERYLLATYGKIYAENPALSGMYREIEQKVAANVGQYIMVQEGNSDLFRFGKIIEPTVECGTWISSNGPFGRISVRVAAEQLLIVGEDGELSYNSPSRKEPIDLGVSNLHIENRWIRALEGDGNGKFEHCSDSNTTIIGDEIEDWLRINPMRANHVKLMIEETDAAFAKLDITPGVPHVKLFNGRFAK